MEDIYNKIDIENKKSTKKHSEKQATQNIKDNIKTTDTNIKERKHTNSKATINTKNNPSYNGIFGNYNEMRRDIENIENEEIREQIEECIHRMEEMENNMTLEEHERLEIYVRIYNSLLNERVDAVNNFLQNGETKENLNKRNLISSFLSVVGINEQNLTIFRRLNIAQNSELQRSARQTLDDMRRINLIDEGAIGLLNIILRADNEIMELFGINSAIDEIVDNIIQNSKNNNNKQNER